MGKLDNEKSVLLAKELVREFQNCDVVRDWLRLDEAVGARSDLQQLMDEIAVLQQKLARRTATDLEQMRFRTLCEKAGADPLIQEADAAYAKVARLAEYVNNLIAAAFEGEDVSEYTEEHFLQHSHRCGEGCGCGDDGCGCGDDCGCGGDDGCGCGHCHDH